MKILKHLAIAFIFISSFAVADNTNWKYKIVQPSCPSLREGVGRGEQKGLFYILTSSNNLGEPAKKANTATTVSPGNLPFQKVNVCFVVNENGNVTEVNVKTNNKQIKQQVQKQMMGLYIKGLEACIVNCTDVFVGG